jgi:hypothetical protein
MATRSTLSRIALIRDESSEASFDVIEQAMTATNKRKRQQWAHKQQGRGGNERTPGNTGGSAESELRRDVDVGGILVLAEQGDVEEDRKRFRICCEHDELRGSAAQALGGLAGREVSKWLQGKRGVELTYLAPFFSWR